MPLPTPRHNALDLFAPEITMLRRLFPDAIRPMCSCSLYPYSSRLSLLAHRSGRHATLILLVLDIFSGVGWTFVVYSVSVCHFLMVDLPIHNLSLWMMIARPCSLQGRAHSPSAIETCHNLPQVSICPEEEWKFSDPTLTFLCLRSAISHSDTRESVLDQCPFQRVLGLF